MAKKKKHYSFKARKEKQKRKKDQAERLFPHHEFEEYWKKHSMEMKRACYDAFLDILRLKAGPGHRLLHYHGSELGSLEVRECLSVFSNGCPVSTEDYDFIHVIEGRFIFRLYNSVDVQIRRLTNSTG